MRNKLTENERKLSSVNPMSGTLGENFSGMNMWRSLEVLSERH